MAAHGRSQGDRQTLSRLLAASVAATLLLPAPTPAAPAPKTVARPGEPESRAASAMSPTLPYEVNAQAVGDFDKIGKPQIALASENSVRLYSYPLTDAKPLATPTPEPSSPRRG